MRLENERKSSWMMHKDKLYSFIPSQDVVLDFNVIIKIPFFGNIKKAKCDQFYMLLCIYAIACLIELLLSVELKGSFLVLNYSVQQNMFVTGRENL